MGRIEPHPPHGETRSYGQVIAGVVLAVLGLATIAHLLLPGLGTFTSHAPHAGKPGLKLLLINGAASEAALVVTDEDTGSRTTQAIPAGTQGVIDWARPGERLSFQVVLSRFDGSAITGACEVVVPADGATDIVVDEDGSFRLVDVPADMAFGRHADGTPVNADMRVGMRNRTTRSLQATFVADDGEVYTEQAGVSGGNMWGSRPMVPGERLKASWVLAAAVTDGGEPLRVEQAGDISLQVRVRPDESWDIGPPTFAAGLRMRLSMLSGPTRGSAGP